MRLIDADKIIFREIDEIGGEYEPYLGCSKSQIDSLPSVTPKEPFINKPCVSSGVCEHDKQKVLDKIRDQLKSHLRGVEITLEVLVENDPLRPKMEGAKTTLEECLELIDKAEKEQE